MWGPGVARVAADLVTHGTTELIDVSDLGLDRFDAQGRSRLASDPIALPFPVAPATTTRTDTRVKEFVLLSNKSTVVPCADAPRDV